MSCHPVSPVRPVLLALAVLALAAGCGGDSTPRTYPVKGKIVFKDKSGKVHLLAGGKVRFLSTSDPQLKPVGEIEDDGSFSMGTMWQEKGLPGVPEGQYKVRIEVPTDDDEGKPLRGLIHTKYENFDKSGLSVTVPVDREVILTVERPGR
jgi:hypothetical protein